MPLESIYHDEWRSMTAQERDFFSLHLFTGYDEADRIIARFIAGASGLPGNEGFNLRAVISPDVGSRMSQAYLETCVREQTAKKTFRKTAADALARQPGRDPAQLILAASSERLPVGSVGMVCNHKRHMAAWVMEKVVAGMPREDFWTLHPLPEHWSPAMKEWAVAMVDEAYLWPRGAEDFSQYIWTSCMEGK